jgi:hypothetical protein
LKSPFWSDKESCSWHGRRIDALAGHEHHIERKYMLYTLAVVLIILWLLGLVTSYTMGGFIHILLVIAVIMILVNLISGRKTVL